MSKIKTASFLAFVAVSTGVLNYITHPILIGNLSESDYVQVMMYSSIMAIITIPSTAFWYALLEFFRSPDRTLLATTDFFKKLQKFSLYHGIFLLFVFEILLFLLHIPFSFTSVLVLLSLFPTLFVSYFSAYIQSREFFYWIGFFSLASSFSRFLFSVLVIFLPSAFFGTLVFVVPTFIVAFCYIFFWKKFLQKENLPKNTENNFSFREKIPSFFGYIFISGLYILLQYLDNILVKIFFSVENAAIYIAAGVLVKFSLVIIGIFETISLPILLDKNQPTLFRKYFFWLIFLMILGLVVSFVLLPFVGNFILAIIKNGMSAPYIIWVWLGVSMVSLGFFSIFAKVLVARKISFYKIFILPLILTIFFFFAHSLEIFVMIFASINISLLLGTIYVLFLQKIFFLK